MTRRVIALTADLYQQSTNTPQQIHAHRVDASTTELIVLQPAADGQAMLTVEHGRPAVTDSGCSTPIDNVDLIRVVGPDRILIWQFRDDELLPAFARQELAFGSETQRTLGALRVAVVGAGGTGSAVFEQLVRLGVGSIVLIDDDTVEATNLTRIHESGMADIDSLKVDVLQRAADRIGLGTVVETIDAKVTDLAAATTIRDCDAIFACTDDHSGRAVLSRTAYRYAIPLIDVGVQISTRNDTVTGIHGAVIVAGPGLPCLHCAGQIDPTMIHAEGLDATERASLAAEGYVPAIGAETPAVLSYTTAVASSAVMQLLHRLIGLPAVSYQLLCFDRDTINYRTPEARADHYCTNPDFVTAADADPHLEVIW